MLVEKVSLVDFLVKNLILKWDKIQLIDSFCATLSDFFYTD